MDTDSANTPRGAATGKKYYTREEISAMLDREDDSRLDDLRRMIDGGLDLEQDWGYHGTLLTTAVECDDDAAVKLLLKHGANPNHKAGIDSRSPLYYAAEEASPEVVRALAEGGASVGDSHAILAAASNCKSEVVRVLLALGAGVEDRWPTKDFNEQQRKWGRGAPLHEAARAHHAVLEDKAVIGSKRQVDTVRALLEAGANVQAVDTQGQTAKAIAEEKGAGDVVSLLQEWESKQDKS